jgi:hypothetical protein
LGSQAAGKEESFVRVVSHLFQVELNLLPGSGSAISGVLFSPSFNLRVVCESEAVLKSLQKPLSKFRAESLENARTAQLSKTNKKSAENVILSIPADQIVPFLVDYCKIPFDAVGCELAKRIRKGLEKKNSLLSRASAGEFVVITPLFVVFGDSMVVSVEEALDRKLFGTKYSKKDVDIDPTVAAVIVRALQLSSMVASKPADSVQLRFSPWLPSESEAYDEDWKEVVKRYNRYTATLCNVFKVCPRTGNELLKLFRMLMPIKFLPDLLSFALEQVAAWISSLQSPLEPLQILHTARQFRNIGGIFRLQLWLFSEATSFSAQLCCIRFAKPSRSATLAKFSRRVISLR